jgi:ubiquitin C-terminal hydrolase
MSHKVGIANVGNTCFMSAVFQALRHCPDFLKFFWKPFVHYDYKKREAVCKSLYDLMTTILATKPPPAFPSLPGVVDPRSFVRTLLDTIRKEGGLLEYRFGEQVDSSEFLQYILETLHEYMRYSVTMEIVPGIGDDPVQQFRKRVLEAWKHENEKNYSKILDTFGFQIHNAVVCANCNNKSSEAFETYLKCELSIPNSNINGAVAPTLMGCIRHSFSNEIVDDYKCSACNVRSSCRKTHQVTRIPVNAIWVLKRFTNSGGKVSGGILWDLDHLDVSSVCASLPAFEASPIYKTYAVIEHVGRAGGGHYYMRARHGNRWFEYNDSSVKEIPTHAVITDNSYIIFTTSSDSYDSFHETVYPTYKALAEASLAPSSSGTVVGTVVRGAGAPPA